MKSDEVIEAEIWETFWRQQDDLAVDLLHSVRLHVNLVEADVKAGDWQEVRRRVELMLRRLECLDAISAERH